MNSSRRLRISIAALVLLSLVTLTGFGCRRSPLDEDAVNRTIVVWGLWQESTHLEPIIAAFAAEYGITVEYRKLASVATYEKDLLEALAQGRGPDVFVIHHTWVEGKQGLMTPAPAEIITERQLRDEFVDVVAQDVLRDGLIYALPTSVDTMALYYNKDILASAGVARPPATWQDLQSAVERITRVTRTGTIQQSAVALGAAANVNRAADILQLLMMQSGLSLLDSAGRADLANDIGERALTFYTDFTNKSKKVYTWDLRQDYSIDAFAEGETAMMLNYSYHGPTIRAKNPRLNFAVAPMPQIADSTRRTFAAYWPFAVSNTTSSPEAAWLFVRYLTSQQPSDLVNQAQGVPPARSDSVETFRNDPTLGVFAEQSLSAVTWPRVDIVATDAIFNRMIDDVVTGVATITDVLQRGEDQLDQLIQPGSN